MQKELIEKAKVLEGLFFDQLEFSLSSVFHFQKVGKGREREILGFIEQLKKFTLENRYIFDKYL